MKNVFIVAEIGKNYIQTEEERPLAEYVENAKRLVSAAHEAGADAVKFQTHHVEDELLDVPTASPLFPNWKGGDRYGWIARVTRAGSAKTFWKPLKAHCDRLGITFFSTPMSRGAAQLLHEEVGVALWKVGSGDILDFVMLDYMAGTAKPIILSSGMSTLEELDAAIDFLKRRAADIALLHCVSKYPCPPEDSNLGAMPFLAKRYGVPVGFSDHSIGMDSALAAVALGATAIEKHFSFSRSLWGPDHKVSMTPDELKALVAGIRDMEHDRSKKEEYAGRDVVKRSRGAGTKSVQDGEAVFRPLFRKSLMAGTDIPAGTVMTAEMLYAMRPQEYVTGTLGALPSEHYENVVGNMLKHAVKKFDPIRQDNLQS